MLEVKIGGKIMFNNVYPREKYLKKIRPFYDSDIIKVITGIRRCGKSFILKAIMNELIEYSANGRPLVTVEKSTQYAGQVHLTKKLNTVGSTQLI